VIITRGLDRCLFVFTLKEWATLSKELSSAPWLKSDTRAFNRRIFGGAQEAPVDKVGRILIPEFLKKDGDLVGEEKAVLVGVHNRIEVWNEKLWSEYRKVTEEKADEIAEKLGDKND
jgi:MraZ protein